MFRKPNQVGQHAPDLFSHFSQVGQHAPDLAARWVNMLRIFIAAFKP